MRLILNFAILGILLVPAMAQEAADDGTKILPSEAKRLLRKAFQGKEKDAAAAKEKLLGCRSEDRAKVLELLETLPRRRLKQPRKKRFVESIETPEAALKSAPCVIRLSARYDGRKPAPLLFRLHGSGDTAEAFDRNCNQDRAFAPFIQVTPQIPSEDRQGWNQQGTQAMLDRIYRKMVADYCVDTDRTYVSGFSAGGGASFVYPQGWPHRFAAFYTMSRLHWLHHYSPEACMDVLTWVPGFFVVGLDDTDDRVQGYRKAEAYYKEKELPGVFHFVERKGHTYLREYDKEAAEFLLKHERQRYPKRFSANYFQYRDHHESVQPLFARCYWLIARKFNPNGTPCTVSVEDNVIEIKAPNLQSASLLLNDHIVNLDESVVVRLNGLVAFNDRVERSMSFLLEWYAEHRDRGDLYWNQITF